MSYFEDAHTLVNHCESKIGFLRTLHAQCLADQAIKPEFQVELKNFVENLRSVLDYCARGLFDKYGKVEGGESQNLLSVRQARE